MLFKLRCKSCDGTGWWLIESKADKNGIYTEGVKCGCCKGKGFVDLLTYLFFKQ